MISKKYFIISLCMSFLLVFSLPSYAQNARTVTGSVMDEFGEPVIGATVMVIGTTTGTVTDMDGKFSLSVPENGKLSVSFIGYLTQTITNLNNPTVTLKEDVAKLDEVVVVGYGTQRMKNVTGAIETITPEEIEDLSVGNLGDALAGMMNGLHVSTSGGRPGSTPSLQIRWAKHPAPYPPCGGRFPSTRPQTVLTCLHVYGFPLVTLLFTIVLNH